jgi:hypothetical protein
MYNRPICGRSTGAYTNLGDLQSPTPPNKNKKKISKISKDNSINMDLRKIGCGCVMRD